jgi:tetratricopeptide (TPR) repeat protein
LPERSGSRARRSANSTAATLQKTAAVMAAMLLIPLVAHGSPSSAYNDYVAGDYKKALEEYLRLLAKNTNDYRLHYDAGAAAYNATNFEEAQKQFTAALNSTDIIGSPTNQERTYFNLGNTLYRLGEGADTDKKKDFWKEAMTNYSRALAIHLNTNDVEAANNLAFVQQQLQQMEQQQKKQDKNDDSKQPEPDAAAKEAKARADAAVMRRQYKQALDIMEDCAKSNPTASSYGDYIKRLQEVNGVANTNHP